MLKLLDASGFWNLDEEALRADEAFHFFAEMMEGLRAQRYQWSAEPRKTVEPFPFDVRIEEWRDISEIDLVPLYGNIQSITAQLPEEIKDALQLLGRGFSERTAVGARRALIDKGYDPSDI